MWVSQAGIIPGATHQRCPGPSGSPPPHYCRPAGHPSLEGLKDEEEDSLRPTVLLCIHTWGWKVEIELLCNILHASVHNTAV